MNHALHYIEHGTGTPLVFIHGFGVDHHLLTALEAVFDDDSKWRRIYLDLPGHGHSPARDTEPSADSVADAVAQSVRDLVGAEPFAVCGNSFGGQLARELVARFREQVLGLALIAPVTRARGERTRGTRRLWRTDIAVDFTGAESRLVTEFQDVAIDDSASAWSSFLRYVGPGLESFDTDFGDRLLDQFELSRQPESAFVSFDGPSLVVTGKQDAAVGYLDQLDLLRSYPHMTYAAFDRAGHNVHLDQPRAVHALFIEWLERVKESRQSCQG